jgi:hypothetical protein
MHLSTTFVLFSQFASALSLLTGTIAPGVQLLHGSCTSGYGYFKHKQLVYISNDFNEEAISETQTARVWCRAHLNDDSCGVSFVQEDVQEGQFSFMLLYRENSKFPRIVTIEGMIRNPEINTSDMSSLQLYKLLRRHCKHRNCYLQMNSLKVWDNGKLLKRMRFESNFEIEDD